MEPLFKQAAQLDVHAFRRVVAQAPQIDIDDAIDDMLTVQWRDNDPLLPALRVLLEHTTLTKREEVLAAGCMEYGPQDLMRLNLDCGARVDPPEALLHRAWNFHTPLTMAVNEGNEDALLLLMERGAQLDRFDMNGKTALLVALEVQNRSMFVQLVSAGGNPRLHRDHRPNALHTFVDAISRNGPDDDDDGRDILVNLMMPGFDLDQVDADGRSARAKMMEDRNLRGWFPQVEHEAEARALAQSTLQNDARHHPTRRL